MNQINSLLESYINLLNSGGRVQLLNLQPGQVVKGNILELIDSKNALVLINNTRVMAKLEVPLTKGQSSWFMVTSVAEEIKLKILTVNNTPSQPVSNLHDLMNNLNIKNTDTNRLIMNEMIKRDIPIDKSLIDNISFTLKDNNINDIFQAVKFLKGKNIEINNPNIRAIVELMQDTSLLDKLNNINKSIDNFLNNINKENPNKLPDIQSNININITDFNVKNTLLENIMTQSKNPSELINNKIKPYPIDEMISQLTKTYSQIDKLINDYKIYSNEKNINLDTTKLTNELNPLELGKVDSKQILTNIVKYLDLLQQQYSNNTFDNNIVKSLEQLLTHRNVLPHDLVANIEKTINHLIGQNYAMTPEQSMFNQAIIQFPSFMSNNKNPVLIQIHTKKKEGSKLIDPEDMLLVFLFNLDNLGDTMVQMKIVQQQILIQINNNNQNIKEIINILEPDFIEFIKNNGYQTAGLTVKPINKKQENKSSSFQSPYKGVDIKI